MELYDRLASQLNEFTQWDWYFPLLAGLLVLLALFLVLHIRVRRRRTPVRVFNNTAGYVMVSRQALMDLVRTATMEVGTAGKPKCRFYTRHNKLSLDIHVKLHHNQRASDICAAIQNHLSRSLRDSLGVDRLGPINVTIDGYKGKGGSKPKTTSSPINAKKTGPVPVYENEAEEQENKELIEEEVPLEEKVVESKPEEKKPTTLFSNPAKPASDNEGDAREEK